LAARFAGDRSAEDNALPEWRYCDTFAPLTDAGKAEFGARLRISGIDFSGAIIGHARRVADIVRNLR
jgi:hypothetical protein